MKALVYRYPDRMTNMEIQRHGSPAERILARMNSEWMTMAEEEVASLSAFDFDRESAPTGGRNGKPRFSSDATPSNLEKLSEQQIALTSQWVHSITVQMLLESYALGILQEKQPVTKHFTLVRMMQTLDTFGNAAKEPAMKTALPRPCRRR
jgi:hypothetical protein